LLFFFQNLPQRLVSCFAAGNDYGAMDDEVMDYRCLSAYLKMPQGTLRQRVMRGEMPHFKIGRNVRFAKKDIDVWLAKHQRLHKQKPAENGGNDLFTAVADGGEVKV